MKIQKVASVIAITILIAVFGFFCFLMAEGVLIGARDIPEKLRWKEKTSPLDPAVVKDLCATFSLPSEDPKCKPNSVVYAPDFFWRHS
jgi:hypothetical protein